MNVRSYLVTMSPIGRVFIVLNLLLAGGFVVFAGTHLQQQHNYKTLYKQEQDDRKKDADVAAQSLARAEQAARDFELAKTTNQNQLAAAQNDLQRVSDENKRLHEQLGAMEGSMNQLLSNSNAAVTASKEAFDQAQAAYKMAQTDGAAKDEAIRAKDTAEAENRTLKTTIASLQGEIETREAAMKKVTNDARELKLLVDAAEARGFLRSMAAPNLAGTVTNAAGTLCTIAVTNNPEEIDIGKMVSENKFAFAVYDASGYKGEAIVDKFVPTENAILCNLRLVKGDVKVGDRAATKP